MFFSGLNLNCICILQFCAHFLARFVVNSSSTLSVFLLGVMRFLNCLPCSMNSVLSFMYFEPLLTRVFWCDILSVHLTFLCTFRLWIFCGFCQYIQNKITRFTTRRELLKIMHSPGHAFSDLLFARADHIGNRMLIEDEFQREFWVVNQCKNSDHNVW